jgi:nicotinamidase-related amidase
MEEITLGHVIGAAYGMAEGGLKPPGPPPNKANTALLLIDIQELASPDYMAKSAIKAGLPEEPVYAALADYGERFEAAVEKCAHLLSAAREYGIPPIHVKIEALSGDARDTSMIHRMVGWCLPPGSEGTPFLAAVTPDPGEIVLTKTVSGCFTGTNLDRVLRHMGIQYLYICGFVTDECVETTFRDALDYGYMSFVARDATTTYFAESHAGFVAKWGAFGLTPTADELIQQMEALPEG